MKFAEVLEMMGAKVTWTDTSVTVTGPPRQPFGRKHLKAVDVNMNKMCVVSWIDTSVVLPQRMIQYESAETMLISRC